MPHMDNPCGLLLLLNHLCRLVKSLFSVRILLLDEKTVRKVPSLFQKITFYYYPQAEASLWSPLKSLWNSE